eukprot:313613_1
MSHHVDETKNPDTNNTYKWIINSSNTIHQILYSTENIDERSDEFHINGISYCVHFNNHGQITCIMNALNFNKISPNWKYIITQFTIKCVELSQQYSSLKTFSPQDPSFISPSNTFSIDAFIKINDPPKQKLTIENTDMDKQKLTIVKATKFLKGLKFTKYLQQSRTKSAHNISDPNTINNSNATDINTNPNNSDAKTDDDKVEMEPKLKTITFIVTIKTLRIILQNNTISYQIRLKRKIKRKHSIAWDLNENDLNAMRNATNGIFQSRIVNENWCLILHANINGGYNYDWRLHLKFCGALPYNIAYIKVKYSLFYVFGFEVSNIDKKFNCTQCFGYELDDDKDNFIEMSDPLMIDHLTLGTFFNYNENGTYSLCSDIELLELYEYNCIEYVDKWKEYSKQEDDLIFGSSMFDKFLFHN